MDNDPFNEYASQMQKVKASDRLLESVLDQAREERGYTSTGRPETTRKLQVRSRRSSRTAFSLFGRSFTGKVAAVACAALVVMGVSFANGLPGLPSQTGEPANTFSLVAFAGENPTGETGQPTTLTKENLDGGYSGAYYDPETQQFWNYREWAGYKYRFNMTCTGQNIESVTYEIDGERAYFEDIDTGRAQEETSTPDNPVYQYSKSITLDYDNQHFEPGENVPIIYLGFPVPDKAQDAFRRIAAGDPDLHLFYDYCTPIDIAAGYALADCRFAVTATFTDGSTQTKRYTIEPVPNFEQLCTDFWEESYRLSRVTDTSGTEPDPTVEPPTKPTMFTIVELSDEDL